MENEQIQNPAAERAAAIGEIILKAREVESRLHAAAGGEVVGIHALTELLGDKLPESLKRQLHFIAAIRNQAAHEAEFQISDADLEAFRKAAYEANLTLERLFPGAEAVESELEDADAPLCVAVEHDAFQRLKHKLHWMGYVPVVGVLNLLRILLSCIYAQLGFVVLFLFYLASIPMLIEGIRVYPDRMELLYTGGITAIAVYSLIVIVSFFVKGIKVPKALIFLPVVNVVYLLVLIAKRLTWGRFLLSLAGLTAFLVMLAGVLNGLWKLAGYALLAEWVLSALCSLCFPPRDEEK